MKQIISVFIWCFVAQVSVGQNTIALPQIINYNKNDFHGGSQTWGIGQDSRGMMYFANNEGLISFDGNRWKLYPIPNKTILRSLYIDKNDQIWVGGQDEIGYFSADKNGGLQYSSLKEKIPRQYNSFSDVWSIDAWNGSIFFRTSDHIFEWKNNNIQVHTPASAWDFLQELEGTLFAMDRNNGLLRFKDNRWHPFRNNKIIANASISGMVAIGIDSFLITTKNSGFYFLHNDSLSKKSLKPTEFASFINTSFKINDSDFFAGTLGRGFAIMNRNGEVVQVISKNEGLQSNNVNFAFLDRDKNIWVGLDNGIDFINYSSAIRLIRPNKDNELAGYATRIFNSRLYIACSNGAYVAQIADVNKNISLSKSDFKLVKNSDGGEALAFDEINQQLLMAHNNGSYIVTNEECSPIATGAGSWLFAPATSAYPVKKILVGCYTGLKMLHFEQNKFTDGGMLEGLHDSYRFLAIDNHNDIWASQPYRGVYRLNISTDNKHFSAELFTDKDGLPSPFENYIFKIKSRVVVATKKGVYEFNRETQKFNRSSLLWPVFDSLDLRYLNEDAEGNIWFCSGKKIGVVDFAKPSQGKGFSITYFPEITNQIFSGFENVYPFNNENIFIGSEKGIILLNYKKYIGQKSKLNILLGMATAIGKKDSLIFGGYFLSDSYKKPMLSPSFNSFHFEYSSPAFGLQKNIEYRYQLEDYDADWSAWLPKTEKDYTNLPSGSYTFKVQARDNLDNESGIIAYDFVINPPWHKTLWARICYVLGAFVIFYLLFKWQRKKLLLQQLKFENEQKSLKYIHQLELEKNEKEIVNLRNEKLEAEVQLKNKEMGSAAMHLVKKGELITRIKDELQKLTKYTAEDKYMEALKKMTKTLGEDDKTDEDWEHFTMHFDKTHNDFFLALKEKHTNLTASELKLCAYLRMNLSTKEMAQLMGISVRGVEISRYRLRKKLQISTETNLFGYLLSLNGSGHQA